MDADQDKISGNEDKNPSGERSFSPRPALARLPMPQRRCHECGEVTFGGIQWGDDSVIYCFQCSAKGAGL